MKTLFSTFGATDFIILAGFGCIVGGVYWIYPPLAIITFGIGLLAAGIVLAKVGK